MSDAQVFEMPASPPQLGSTGMTGAAAGRAGPPAQSHKPHALLAQVALRGELRAAAERRQHAQQPDRGQVGGDRGRQRRRRQQQQREAARALAAPQVLRPREETSAAERGERIRSQHAAGGV